MNLDLATDIVKAKQAAARRGSPGCRACAHLDTMQPGVEKDQVSDAMAGSIGLNKLEAIFRKHGVPVGRRSIVTHRRHLGAEHD